MLSNRERLILLNLVPGIGSLRLTRLLERFGHLDRLWAATVQELMQVEGIGPALAQGLVTARSNESVVSEELALAAQEGVRLVTQQDAEYPDALRQIPDPPLALYVRGRLPAQGEAAVAIVGSRRASFDGLRTAERLAYELALRGVTIISGLARGIDSAAHRGALAAGPALQGGASGRTVAVLGCGLCRVYPPEHAELARQISEHGAVMSEYPMRMAPLAENFPRRNRLISGLSLGVVIVEAASRSGALITADQALEQGREVFAVPGPISRETTEGTHRLLKQGARLVTSVEDIVEELRLVPQAVIPTTVAAPRAQIPPLAGATGGGMAAPEQRIMACLGEDEPRDIDAITKGSGLPAGQVAAVLLTLELQRSVRQLPGKQFVRTSEQRS